MTWQAARYQVETADWSQYRTGVCNDCGCQFWADYGRPFAYYYNPMTVRAKAQADDPRLEIIRNIQGQIEAMYTKELIDTSGRQKEPELIGALASVNAGLFKVIAILKRKK